MKPKDKASELVDKFNCNINFSECFQGHRASAKQCALICVDEMLLELEDIEDGYRMDRVEYWKEVKQEIKKL